MYLCRRLLSVLGSTDELGYAPALSASEVATLASSSTHEPAETFAFLGLMTAFGLGFREWLSRRKSKVV